jgi:hypothetical protein
MATIVIDRLETDLSDIEIGRYSTVWLGHDKDTGVATNGYEVYEEPDGFVAAWYAAPTNAGNEIDGVAAP